VTATKIHRKVKYNILSSPLDKSPITLIAHMTAERLAMLEQVARHWKCKHCILQNFVVNTVG